MKSIQETYAPHSLCFGCGPSNSQGLRIKSYVDGNLFFANFKPESYHQAFENVLSGGIVGTLLDCHSNWCAAYSMMKFANENAPACTVTAYYSVELLKPTPMDSILKLVASPIKVSNNKAEINAELLAQDVCTARCSGLFVAVSPGHPAFHRW